MANIMERITADNKTTYTARIRIKGYRQQTATFPRIQMRGSGSKRLSP